LTSVEIRLPVVEEGSHPLLMGVSPIRPNLQRRLAVESVVDGSAEVSMEPLLD